MRRDIWPYLLLAYVMGGLVSGLSYYLEYSAVTLSGAFLMDTVAHAIFWPMQLLGRYIG